METFLFENRTDATTEPHKNHTTMYVHFLSFVGISHFQFAPNLCVIPLLTIQNVLTLTPSDTLNKQISFGLGQSVGQTTNTSVYTNKSREFVALALVPDGLQHLIRFFTHV